MTLSDLTNKAPGVRFDMTVNLGHVLTMIGLMLTLAAGGYGIIQTVNNVDFRVSIVEKQLGSMSRLMESAVRVETEIDNLDRRVTVLEGRVR